MKETEPVIIVQTPLYLVTSTAECWKCGLAQNVIALATPALSEEGDEDAWQGDDEPYFLEKITRMPEAVRDMLQKLSPRFREFPSKAADMTYYANICECGANFGDHFLFSEPGGAFFPMADEDFTRMSNMELPFKGTLKFCCTWGQGNVGEVLEKSKHVIPPPH